MRFIIVLCFLAAIVTFISAASVPTAVDDDGLNSGEFNDISGNFNLITDIPSQS